MPQIAGVEKKRRRADAVESGHVVIGPILSAKEKKKKEGRHLPRTVAEGGEGGGGQKRESLRPLVPLFDSIPSRGIGGKGGKRTSTSYSHPVLARKKREKKKKEKKRSSSLHPECASSFLLWSPLQSIFRREEKKKRG